MGSHFEGRNATHQMKKLTLDDLKGFRDRLQIDIADDALDAKLLRTITRAPSPTSTHT